MGADSYDEDDEEVEGPRSSFSTYLAEGDVLFKQGEYKKALESYSLAHEIQVEDKTCLVARSKCYLKLGDPAAALQDAEAALAEDKNFNKGLYQKAEALYSMGDFEYALMYYHRGHKLRPELDEFRLGIQKAQEAIDNSIGSAAKIKLENKGDLSFFTKTDDAGKAKRGYTKPGAKPKPTANRKNETKVNAPSKKTVKQLLGEVYADKEYLEKLMQDEGFIKDRSNAPIYELVSTGLQYLETRTEFWRQQKPLYARTKQTKNSKKSKMTNEGKEKNRTKRIGKFIVDQLEAIDEHLTNGEADKSLQVAQETLKKVEAMPAEQCPNKDEIIPNLHSCIGNAFVELDQMNKALRQHQKDLELSRRAKLDDGISRALDNIGRVYARKGQYELAVKSWTEKIPLLRSPMESAWLYHEVGRCHIELQDFETARDYGKKSLTASQEAEDQVWELNASVLIAQSEVKLGNLASAITSFENALKFAEALNDEAAKAAVTKALDDLTKKLSGALGGSTEEETTTVESDEPTKQETTDDASDTKEESSEGVGFFEAIVDKVEETLGSDTDEETAKESSKNDTDALKDDDVTSTNEDESVTQPTSTDGGEEESTTVVDETKGDETEDETANILSDTETSDS